MTAAGTAIVGFRLEKSIGLSGERPQVCARPAPMSVNVSKISLALGGRQSHALDAGVAHKNRLYLVAGSVTGSNPGIRLGAVRIPLNYDPWTDLTILLANSTSLPSSRGKLDATGRATAGLVVPKGLTDPALVGLYVYSAALVYDASGNYYLGTNAAVLQLVK